MSKKQIAFVMRLKYFNHKVVFLFISLLFSITLLVIEKTGFAHTRSNRLTVKSAFSHLLLQKKKPQQHLSVSSANDNDVWSNAFNFQKSWGTVVDPRTGVLMIHFKVGSLLSNTGHGPDINLQINYNSNVFSDPDGIGAGWSWNLTHFNLITNQLATAGGQIFWLHQTGKDHWQPLYHKLYDIKIDGDKSTHFTLTYANGLREVLSHEGYETRLEQQNGWGVNFIYHQGTHLLQSITDDEGNKITVDRSQSYLDIISHKINGKPAIIRIENHNGKPDKLRFILTHESSNPAIYLNYKNHLLTHIIYPTGLEKTFAFNCTDAMKFPLPPSNYNYSLCVVADEITNPGAGEPSMKIHHLYSHANKNDHNYLGFNSGLTSVESNQKDLLFEAPASYSYRTITDNGLVRDVRVYNKYHLQIDDKLISDRTGRTMSETQSYYCNTKIADGCSRTSFADLPFTYSLPLKIVTRTWGTSSGPPAVTTITRAYDDFGRVIKNKDPHGRTTLIHYCPVKGDKACPAMPEEWPFNLLQESVTHYPAIINKQRQQGNTVYNLYRKQPNLHGAGYILVLDHQIQQAGHNRIILGRYYYTDPKNKLTYGLLKQTILTDTTFSSPHAVTHSYSYTQNRKNHSRTTNVSIEISPNKWQNLSSVVTSLFTNQKLESTGAGNRNKKQYYYDSFECTIQHEIDSGTAFSITLRYQYILSPGHNQVIITTANGLQQKIVFDNAGRELMRFNETVLASGAAVPGHWQLKQSLHYDAYGRVTEKNIYKKDASNHIYKLTTTKEYDDMGRIHHIHLPDGETTFILYDNYHNCVVSYRQSVQGELSPAYIVQENLLDKPVKKRIIPASSKPFPSAESLCRFQKMAPDAAKTETTAYDGWGRPVMTEDNTGKIIHKHYNEFGRLDEIIDSAGNHIHLIYDFTGHVIRHWILPASGGRYLLSSSGYNNAGQLLYKAGEDGKKTTYTYTETGQPATILTPGGHLFSWQYNEVGLPVAKYLDGKILLQTDYDHLTTKPIKKRDITGITTWQYGIDGLTEKEIHSGQNNYPDYQFYWHYNNNREIMNSTDINGDTTYIRYDRLRRIATISYHPKQGRNETLYTPTYGAFSRINTIHYGSGMQRVIHYDNWGRQLEVTDTLANQLLSRWQFGYNADNNIVRLHQQTENHQESILTYQYDQLDNLVSMHCRGSFGLPLCPRDTAFLGSGLSSAPIITDQHYTFTPLNRLEQVKEVLHSADQQQTLEKVLTYHYSNALTPLRLQRTDTQWNQQIPIIQHLHYDNSGNMTTDGEGNQIAYNAFNHIVRVIKPDGEQSHYIYDGGGREVMEKTRSAWRYLFYYGNKLINEKVINSANKSHIIGYHEVATTMDGILHEYTEKNYKNDIVGLLTKTTQNNKDLYQLIQRNIYSPYGMVWHSKPTLPALALRNVFGFDGERTEPATGWQFLGAGHRTYNPQQRHFVSEDPAGNGYAFASNNPIMKTDPSGNLTKTEKQIFRGLTYIGTLGLSAIHGKWGRISGSLLMLGLSTLSAAFAGLVQMSLTGVAIYGIGTITLGIVPVVSSIIPSNSGLNVAAAVMGVFQLSIT
ncbi:MAG: hypothetical protein OXC48_04450, partial [Endozoicomonadaceae bacterium]|nr:hypothetical protein [Endozoicomonadaceae bacterium]